jgi:hypothetical protein
MYERSLREEQFTLMMMSVPWGLFSSIMGFWQYDWENDRLYNYLMWQRTYDKFSLNLILYSNPDREAYLPDFSLEPPEEVIKDLLSALPETLTGFGNGIQFMIVFNH